MLSCRTFVPVRKTRGHLCLFKIKFWYLLNVIFVEVEIKCVCIIVLKLVSIIILDIFAPFIPRLTRDFTVCTVASLGSGAPMVHCSWDRPSSAAQTPSETLSWLLIWLWIIRLNETELLQQVHNEIRRNVMKHPIITLWILCSEHANHFLNYITFILTAFVALGFLLVNEEVAAEENNGNLFIINFYI